MIASIQYIQHMQDMYKNTPRRKYPCSNQIVRNIIWVSAFDDIVKNYLVSRGAKCLCKSYTSPIYEIDGEQWIVIRASNNARGYRSYKSIIDSRIDIKQLYVIVNPSCNLYCCDVSYF